MADGIWWALLICAHLSDSKQVRFWANHHIIRPQRLIIQIINDYHTHARARTRTRSSRVDSFCHHSTFPKRLWLNSSLERFNFMEEQTASCKGWEVGAQQRKNGGLIATERLATEQIGRMDGRWEQMEESKIRDYLSCWQTAEGRGGEGNK